MKSMFDVFKKFLSNENMRHLLANYSMTSHGARHPCGPVGWILRDEGQVDIYAGKTRTIMGLKGEMVNISTFYHNISERTNFTTQGISNFIILGKFFNKELFESQKVLAVKPGAALSSLSLIGPNTIVINEDGTIGKIVGAVPMLTIFDEKMIFDTEADPGLFPPVVEIANKVKGFMGARK